MENDPMADDPRQLSIVYQTQRESQVAFWGFVATLLGEVGHAVGAPHHGPQKIGEIQDGK